MGLLDVYAAQSSTAVENPLRALPRTAGERFEATFAESFAPDRYFTRRSAEHDMWQRAADELHGATGETFANPYGAVTPEEMMRLGNQPAVEQERRQKIIDASRMARAQGNDSLFDPENIERYIAEESIRRRDKAASYVDTGNGLAAFGGSVVGETLTPHGLIGLAIPVTRLPSAASAAVGRTFLGNVLREAGFQAGANMSLQGVAELLDYASRRETGTEQTAGEVLTNVAGAGVFGGLIGGSARALHLAWLRLPAEVRATAPVEVRDAFRVIESEALYTGHNRLGVDPLLHERYQGRALDAVMRGAPVDMADLARTADTPLTALGTILRQPTDQAAILRLIGTPDEGMRDAFARTTALPDSEIAAFAREVRPNSFARLDRVETELQAANAKLAEIDARQPSIADLVDPDTGMRLQDIERDLAAPALSRKERTALEREREMILSTVDPKDRLPKQAEKAQRAERAVVEKEIAKLERVREEAKVTADAATADLRRKLGRYADLIEPQDVARDLGFKEPADLDAAIQRADVMRQARTLREILPEGIGPALRPDMGIPASAPVEEITPEAMKALNTETARLVETRPDLEVEIGGRTMSASKAMEEADRIEKEAQIAMGCAIGAM